jgi:basic amino acid/polyamine antiporter, APA family
MSDMSRELRLPTLILMGLGTTVGAGVFVITGTVAANYAGPAVALSYAVACLLCLCPAVCYAELAAMKPDAAGAYTFSRASMGRFAGWITGWLLLLEYLMAAATLAAGWSAYLCGYLDAIGLAPSALWSASTLAWQHGSGLQLSGTILNVPAVLIVLALTAVLCLGTKESARVTAIIVIIKLITILTIVVAGATRLDPANWHPFVPPNGGQWGEFGTSGILRGASVVFVAYLGFDVVATVASEVREPQRTVPRAILAVVAICPILYALMAFAITGLAPYSELNVANPVALATSRAGLTSPVFTALLATGTVVGLTSGMLAILFAQARILLAMARDGLLPAAISRMSGRFGTPVIATLTTGSLAALLAGVLPLTVLSELIAIGTLSIFVLVCVGALILRWRVPGVPRPFRVRGLPLVAICGTAGCLVMMLSLPVGTWERFAVWLALGLLLYALARSRRATELRRAVEPLKCDSL